MGNFKAKAAKSVWVAKLIFSDCNTEVPFMNLILEPLTKKVVLSNLSLTRWVI